MYDKKIYFKNLKLKVMSIIIKIHARQIVDSRGKPTIAVDVITDRGV